MLPPKLLLLCHWLLGVSNLASASAVPCSLSAYRLSVDYHPAPVPASGSSLARISDRRFPLLGWWLQSTMPNQTQSAFQIQVSALSTDFPEPLTWDSGRVNSSDQTAILYGGPAQASGIVLFWRVAVWDGAGAPCNFSSQAVGAWEVPLLTEGDWAGAAWITRLPPHPPLSDCELYSAPPAPLFRAQFTLSRDVSMLARARLHIAGLGYYKAYLSGTRIGDAELDPAWTAYNASTYYTTYDLTPQLANTTLSPSVRVLGVALGNGWWNMPPLRFWGSHEFRSFLPTGEVMFKAALLVQYTDGSMQTLVSSSVAGVWSVGLSGTLSNSIHLGVAEDRRQEQVGWSTPAFVPTANWTTPFDAPAALVPKSLRAARMPPVRRQAPLRPVSNHSSGENSIVFDAGKNIAGVCEYCMSGPAGATITFKYGELLYLNGSVNGMTSVAGQIKRGNGGPCAPTIAYQTDSYTLRGDAQGECWAPDWTWHGFRYVEAAGAAAASIRSLTCWPLRTDVERTGVFVSSSDLINKVRGINFFTRLNLFCCMG